MREAIHPVAAGKFYWEAVKQTFTEFLEDKAPRLGAALAYYTIFSIAPLLVIAIGVAGWFFGNSADTRVEEQVTALMGPQGGKAVEAMIDSIANQPKTGVFAIVVGLITLLVGAAGVFGQLQDALNTIWKVTPKPGRGIWGFVRDRFLSFAMVGGICFLLLVSLVISVALSGLDHYLGGEMPGWPIFLKIANLVVSTAVIMLLFSIMFKVLPDVKMAWRDVWVGGFVTAVLFTFGKWAIGVYLGHTGVGSAYGAAGSLVVVILWIYYAAQIFLLGAEFTQVYSKRKGRANVPDDNAVALTDDMRAKQGIPRDAVVARNVAVLESVQRDADRVHQNGDGAEKKGRLLPATLGFAVGFAFAKRWRAPRRKKLATDKHG